MKKLVDGKYIELSETEIAESQEAYHAWLAEQEAAESESDEISAEELMEMLEEIV